MLEICSRAAGPNKISWFLIVGHSFVWSVCWLLYILYFLRRNMIFLPRVNDCSYNQHKQKHVCHKRVILVTWHLAVQRGCDKSRPCLFHLNTTTHCSFRLGYGSVVEHRWTRTVSSGKQQVDIPYGDCHHGGVHGGGAFNRLVFHEQPFQSPRTPQLIVPLIQIFHFHSLVWPRFARDSVHLWIAHRVLVLKLKVWAKWRSCATVL